MSGSTLNPLGPVAGAYCLDNHEIAAIMGPVGSAKTTGSMLRLARHAWEQTPWPSIIKGKKALVAYSRFAIVRNTGPQLVDTTMKSWFKLFPTDNKYRKYTSTTKTQLWEFQIGTDEATSLPIYIHAEFMFRALDDEDDVANLLSLEVTGFYFNELREIDTTILAHAGRRAGRYPGADMGGCKWRGWIGDTNPWAFTSDLHQMFVVEQREGYKFFKQPGGMDADAENLENLEQTQETLKLPYHDPRRREQGRTYYINALRDYNKADADMYVHCKYGVSRAGKPVYESYDDNAHCKPFELQSIKPAKSIARKNVIYSRRADGVEQSHESWTPLPVTTPIKIGYDNTGRTPAALIAQRTADGHWRVRYEFIGEGMGLKAHVRELAAFLAEKIPDYSIEKITCDPAGAAKDSDELDMRMVVQKQFPGVMVVNARTNDIATRIEAFDGPLRRMINGEPALTIHPDCKFLRAACTHKYQYRKLKIAGEERYTEEPDKSAKPYDDIANAGQYLMLGGGEGRVNSGAPGEEVKWPSNGQAIVPKAPAEKEQERGRSRPVFDPRNGSVFRDF